MGSFQAKQQLFNPIRNTYTQACSSHNPASSTQRQKVNSSHQCQIHYPFSSGFWRGTSPPSASHHAGGHPTELSWLLKSQLTPAALPASHSPSTQGSSSPFHTLQHRHKLSSFLLSRRIWGSGYGFSWRWKKQEE